MSLDITYQFMIPMLQLFQKATHSYGWGIVFLTLLVRLLVWPLVANQTRSMMRMSQLQPQIKKLQERYKSDPEQFQKKTMEFYSKNKINPMGGCLPLLVQFPILIALFSTFTGPPFGDKTIDVKVHVVDQSQTMQVHRAETSGANCSYVSPSGMLGKVIVFPGESTITKGQSIDFSVRALQGQLPPDFKVHWNIYGKPQDIKGFINTEPYGSTFHATFPNIGDFVVKAKVPGIAKNESFGFIHSLGKVASGAALLSPENWDSTILIILFGLTMFVSQKFTMPPTQQTEGELDESQLAQRQAMKIMPVTMTAMFFFIPLPAGVYLYMVISNVMQSLQTFIVMKQPAPALAAVIDDVPADASAAVIDAGFAAISSNSKTSAKQQKSTEKAKAVVATEEGSANKNGQVEPDKRKKKKNV